MSSEPTCKTTIKQPADLLGPIAFTVQHGPNPEAILEVYHDEYSDWDRLLVKLSHWLYTAHQRCCDNPNVYFYVDGSLRIECWEHDGGGFGGQLGK